MYNVKKVNEDLYWIGASDRRLALFENIYPIPRGVSYNSYVILDEKTVLLDTVDKAVSGQFFENLEHVLDGRSLDYIIVNHMEPDHCAIVEEVVRRFPEVKVVGNAKTFGMAINGDKGMELIYFDPNEAIIKDMQRIAPRSVKLY